jgi:hypothetical protein
MKAVHFFFVLIIAVVLLPGASLGQADRPSQQSSLQRGEKSGDRQNDAVRKEKDQTRPKEADENREQLANVTRNTTQRRASASHPKPVPTYRVRKPTANSPQIHEPGSVAPLKQVGSKKADSITNKAVSRHSPSIPSSAVSVNGHQFRNSRDPGAHLATSGGPAAIARGTAAISGTDMKRKP